MKGNTMKTTELTGVALDWAVAKCEGISVEYINDGITQCLLRKPSGRYSPSTDWAQGGPIIDREGIAVTKANSKGWTAQDYTMHFWGTGPTPLISAMRCYVASKLGETIETPEEITR
jgi:hypothetical protein